MAEKYVTEEPRGRGVRVVDRDGHIWRRGTKYWSDATGVDESFRGRARTWSWLVEYYGPVISADRFQQHQHDRNLAALAYLPDEMLIRYGLSRAEVAAAEAREAEWNAS